MLEMFAGPLAMMAVAVIFLVPTLTVISFRNLKKERTIVEEKIKAKKQAYCPNCTTNLYGELHKKTDGKGYSTVTCACKTISKWEIVGNPPVLQTYWTSQDSKRAS